MNISITPSAAKIFDDTGLLSHCCRDLLAMLDKEDKILSVVLMDDSEIAEYNKRYRQKSGPTNVLSFPVDSAETIAGMPEEELGDILISVETAQREAVQKNTELSYHLTELLIHGLLHLLGWDHERSEDEAIDMWNKEKALIHKLLNTRRTAMPHLAINVDHVATVRQARGTIEPDPVLAAGICELAGAEGIVVHLREDRRHIQDRDVRLLRQTIKTRMNLEMAMTKEMIGIALEVKPDLVTLVPEKRRELTTEGGLDVAGNIRKVDKAIAKLAKGGIPVSLFIDPDAEQVEASAECGATFVELHTGRYCDAPNEIKRDAEFRLIQRSAELAAGSGLRVNAGHGLDYRNTSSIAAIPEIDELSIGHAVISRAVIVGLDQAVREMLALVKGARRP